MPMTLDQRAVSLLEDFELPDPIDAGAELYSKGAFRRLDAVGVYDPRTVWVSPHNNLPALSHLVQPWVGSAASIVTSGQPFPNVVTAYYDAGQTKKAAVTTYTRNALQQATSIVTQTYAADGVTLTGTCTDTVAYVGGFETARSRVVS